MKLKDIKKLIDAATPGPWADDGSNGIWSETPTSIVTVVTYENGREGTIDRKEDAAFIAASRTLMPKLLAVVDAIMPFHNHHRFGAAPKPTLEQEYALGDALAALEADP